MPHTLVDISQLPSCAGTFFNGFVITPETTRADVVTVARCGNHHIDVASGQYVHDLYCDKCGEWIGDAEDPEIAHVSTPLTTECRPSRVRKFDEADVPRLRADADDRFLAPTNEAQQGGLIRHPKLAL